jgi:hypothetical protein
MEFSVQVSEVPPLYFWSVSILTAVEESMEISTISTSLLVLLKIGSTGFGGKVKLKPSRPIIVTGTDILLV